MKNSFDENPNPYRMFESLCVVVHKSLPGEGRILDFVFPGIFLSKRARGLDG